MSYLEITGDLLDPGAGFDAIGHGVNLHGVMGAGIALAIASRWPKVIDQYRADCRSGKLDLGGYQRFETRDGQSVYNLATQRRPGPNAQGWAIMASVTAALDDAEQRGHRHIAIPRIGCGIGGLEWDEVKDTLIGVAEFCGPDLIVVTYQAGQRAGR